MALPNVLGTGSAGAMDFAFLVPGSGFSTFIATLGCSQVEDPHGMVADGGRLRQ